MKHLAILVTVILLLPTTAFAAAETCEELKALTRAEVEAGLATYGALLDCKVHGEDPPKHLRNRMGASPVNTSVGNEMPPAPCRPGVKEQCPNNMREYTDGSNSPSGYDPLENPNLNIPELPWGKLNDQGLPCGAIATFAEGALQSLLNKASVNVPISLDDATVMIDGINTQFTSLQTLLNGISNGTVAEAQANGQMNDISSQINSLISQVPMLGGAIKGQAYSYLSSLQSLVSNLVANQATLPPGEVSNQLSQIDQHITNLTGVLNDVRNFISSVQGEANSLIGDIKDKINDKLTGLLGDFFKHRDCQDGRFWGVLNHIFTLVMGQGKYTYDLGESTFMSPNSSVLVTMPLGSTLNITGGSGTTAIMLPAGGTFHDYRGHQINLAPGTTTEFRSGGLVVVSDGNQYRIDRQNGTELYPNEVIGIPPGTPIPVDPKGKVYPMAPVTKQPAWLDEDYAASK